MVRIRVIQGFQHVCGAKAIIKWRMLLELGEEDEGCLFMSIGAGNVARYRRYSSWDALRMRFLPASIAGVTIWRRFCRYLHLPSQTAAGLQGLPVVGERSAVIRHRALVDESAGEMSRRGRGANVG
jgi:hypothetical protein